MNTTAATCPLPTPVQTPVPQTTGDRNGWPVAGLLLDALTRRDFAGIRACLDDRVIFRALVPRGLIELDDAADVAARFALWFGGEDSFEVLDASVGQVGGKLYARWKVRMTSAGGASRVAEQHVYTRGTDRIETLDLLCSGFHEETVVAS